MSCRTATCCISCTAGDGGCHPWQCRVEGSRTPPPRVGGWHLADGGEAARTRPGRMCGRPVDAPPASVDHPARYRAPKTAPQDREPLRPPEKDRRRIARAAIGRQSVPGRHRHRRTRHSPDVSPDPVNRTAPFRIPGNFGDLACHRNAQRRPHSCLRVPRRPSNTPTPPAEGCRSGRTGRSRKPLWVQAHRGFESLSLRHHPRCEHGQAPIAALKKSCFLRALPPPCEPLRLRA
jgi:hypothetical protein